MHSSIWSFRITSFIAVAAVLCAACSGSKGSAGSGGSGAGSGTGTETGSGGAPACSPGLSAGFATVPSPFSLPAPRCQVKFDALAKDIGGGLGYALIDLTADGKGDLVVFSDSCDPDVGAKRWDVYAASPAGFASTPAPYTLPAPRCQVEFDAAAKADAITYALLDINADGRVDLVVFSDMCDGDVGTKRWDVYLGGPSGFAASPTPYTIPAPRCQTRFDAAGNGSQPLVFSLMDLDADGKSDLVVFSDGCDATVGRSHWDLYAGGATGFAATPRPFAIPPPRCQTPFDAAAKAWGGAVKYSVLSLDAAKSELVVFSDGCDATVGESHWDVYGWSPSGFSALPSPFGVPAPRCQVKFDASVGVGNGISFSLASVSCHSAPDLVVSSDSCDPDVGSKRWDVYVPGASGFAATPAPLTIPAARCQTKFDALTGDSGGLGFALTAFLGGKPQLAVFRDGCDPAVGESRWDLYALP